MTITIPRNLSRAESSVEGQLLTLIQRNRNWQHVWIWDELNGQLTLSQFRRGKYVVKVNHWHSPNMMSDFASARMMLRKDRSEPQWFGKTAVQYLNRAFTH